MTVPTLEIDSVDVIDGGYVQFASLKSDYETLDVTLIGYDPGLLLSLQCILTHPDVTFDGIVTSTSKVTSDVEGIAVLFTRVVCKSSGMYEDQGHAPYDLSDTPDNVDTFDFADMVLDQELTDGLPD